MISTLRHILTVTLTLIGLSMALEYAAYRFMPRETWFTYYSLNPIASQFTSGQTLKFISERTVLREAHMVWEDTLFCRPLGHPELPYETVSQYTSYTTNMRPTIPFGGIDRRIWSYQAASPDEDSQCYLRSYIAAKLPYGLTKEQVISDPDNSFVVLSNKSLDGILGSYSELEESRKSNANDCIGCDISIETNEDKVNERI